MKKMMFLKSFAIVIALLVIATSAHAEGLLPSLSETIGIAMPSLGEALQRYPDSETENDDGSVIEIYTNVSKTDFNIFSVYLDQQGAELADYHVEGSELTAEIRAKDASFSLSYDSKSGEAKVTYPAGTFSEWMKNAETHFVAGKKLLEEGKADEAYEKILEIPRYSEYAPVVDLLQNDDNLAAARNKKIEPFRTLGNTVVFGRYEQDNNMANGPEEIQWIVLDYDEKEHKVLLLSQYGLNTGLYNTKYVDVTWENCTLRDWLNAEFLQSAFSAQEQAAILVTTVDNSTSQGYSEWDMDGGNNTQDQVFLLSYAEANQYLNVTYDDKDNTKARVAPTAYAIKCKAWTSDSNQTADGDAAGWWWLRSPGSKQTYAAYVSSDGSLKYCSVSVDLGGKGVVRPALWLNLESDIF